MTVLEGVLATLAAHVPADAAEAADKRRILALLRWLRAPLDRAADPCHVTASAVVLRGPEVLLHRHRRLGLWLQPGGHLDPGESPSVAAVREAREETGVRLSHPGDDPELVHVEVHEGPHGHVHLDLRYRLEVVGDPRPRPRRDESRDVAWFPATACPRPTDPRLARLLRRLVSTEAT